MLDSSQMKRKNPYDGVFLNMDSHGRVSGEFQMPVTREDEAIQVLALS
jgi:hypothetical protein